MPITFKHAFVAPQGDWVGTNTCVVPVSSGGTTTDYASNLVRPSDWNAEHLDTLGISASEIASLINVEHRITMTTNAGGVTLGLDNALMYYENFIYSAANMLGPVQSSWYFQPMNIYGALDSGVLQMLISMGSTNTQWPLGQTAPYANNSTGTLSKSAGVTHRVGLWSRGSDASNSGTIYNAWSTLVSMQFSCSHEISASGATSIQGTEAVYATYPGSYDSLGGITYSNISGSAAFSAGTSSINISSFSAHSNISGVNKIFSGGIVYPVPLNYRISAGDWYLGFAMYSASASGGNPTSAYTGMNIITTVSSAVFALATGDYLWRGFNSTLSNSTSSPQPGQGIWSAATSYPGTSFALSQIRHTNSNYRQYFNYQNFWVSTGD